MRKNKVLLVLGVFIGVSMPFMFFVLALVENYRISGDVVELYSTLGFLSIFYIAVVVIGILLAAGEF